MISEQYGTVFTGEHYEKLQKVYSIWICPDPAKKRRNGIFRYYTVQDTVLGKPYESPDSYDLMEVVIVNLGDADKESDLEILDLLNTLFSLSISPETKKARLQDDFGIAMTEEFESEVQDMCNLGKALVEQGIEQGIEQGVEQGVKQKNLSLAKMMLEDKEPIDKIKKYTGFATDKLEEIAKSSGKYISRGVSVDSLDTQKKWSVHMTVKEGDIVQPGSIIAETQETASILHKSMVPPDVPGGTVVRAVPDGDYTILEPIVTVQLDDGTTRDLALAQKWPIRIPRPTQLRYPASVPLVTGQRILDTLFPIAKGGTAAGWFRYRKDHDTASDRQMVRCGYHHLHRMRRAWKRNDPGSRRLQQTDRPEIRKPDDGPYHSDCQHFQHACSSP